MQIGNLFAASRITNLNPLNSIEIIKGNLVISRNDSLPTLEGLNQLQSIHGNLNIHRNDALKDLEGFNNLQSIHGSLSISRNNALTTLKALNRLDSINGNLDIHRNGALKNLEGLDQIRCINGGLNIYRNNSLTDLKGLEGLNSVKEQLRIVDNNLLTNLEGLEDITSITNNCWIRGNGNLEDLKGLNNLCKVENFLIADNPKLKTLNGLNGLQTTRSLVIADNKMLLHLNALQNLQEVSSHIEIRNNSALKSLTGLRNLKSSQLVSILLNDALESLAGLENISSNTITDLYLQLNPALTDCHYLNICNFIQNSGLSFIVDNGENCSTSQEILAGCNEQKNTIQYTIFYDLNNNKLRDTNELNLPDAEVFISSNLLSDTITSRNVGEVFVEDGFYTIEFNPLSLPEWILTTDSLSYHVEVGEDNKTSHLEFGVIPSTAITDITTVINAAEVNCGKEVVFHITAKNTGTTDLAGTLWFFMDDLLEERRFIDEIDTVQERFVGWHFDGLQAGQILTKKVAIHIPTRTDLNDIGYFLFRSFVNGISSDLTVDDGTFIYAPTYRCIPQTNDKLVAPNHTNEQAHLDEPLLYTIRFQNTQLEEIHDLLIKDTIDQNLDISTFEVVSCSHFDLLNVQILEDHILQFSFDNIYLPDSTTDFIGSQGFVSYKIQPYPNLPIGTMINNSANISFDRQQPLRTNQTPVSYTHLTLPTTPYV